MYPARIIRYGIFLLLILMSVMSARAQEDKKIQLLGANKLVGLQTDGQELQILVGDVKLKHENTIFYCDSALRNPGQNAFNAYENVHINVNDSLDIYSDSLHYDGNTKIAELFGEVRLVDDQATLYTDYLIYNRNTRIGSYITWGRIEDADNELTSNIGYYYSRQKEFFFKDDVIVNTPDYMMYSDTLMYNTESEIAYIHGPTNIIGEKDSVYCEWGWYDTKKDIANLKINVFIQHLEQSIEADTVYYDKDAGFGEAFNNITITDTLQDAIVKGHYAHYLKSDSSAYVTDSAVAIFIDKRDSLFLHSDTLKVLFDSTDKARFILAYNKVKFFRDDLQGASDSLAYDVKDSTIRMYRQPVLWADDNQLTADSIWLAIADNELDSIAFFNNCFIISRDDSGKYNQIKGKNMVGYFKKNQLYKLVVTGNSETIYFVRDEETGGLMGVNKLIASDMLVFMEKREITTISYLVMPQATMYPPGELAPQDLFLRDFDWKAYQRPRVKWEIFHWKKPAGEDKPSLEN